MKIKIFSIKVASWVVQIALSSMTAIGAMFSTSIVMARFECSYSTCAAAVLSMGALIFLITMEELK